MTTPLLEDDRPLLPGDPGIVQEAVERWKACKDWQGVEDERTREDIKFANADARNAWQWPKGIYDKRSGGNLPCLTINNTRVHNDLIINKMSKNGFGTKIRPVGGEASYKAAQVMQSLVNRIQYISKGSAQRRKVAEQQVDGGIGYMLIETKYVSNKTRNQEIYLKASRDPTGVYLDPWIREPDGSDANFGFVFERMPRKEFNRKYPDYKNKVGAAPLETDMVEWLSDKEIMLAKYFRKSQKPDTFVWYETEEGQGIEKLASEIKDESGPEIYKALMEDIKEKRIDGGTRKVFNDEVEWFLIAGNQIVDRGDWAGKYIPICRCVGREVVVDATLDRKGHTRPLIDANRMLNYHASVDVQVGAFQTKTPWLASARAIEGQEQWKTANVDDFDVMIWNDVDDEAQEGQQNIAAPTRIEPPRGSPAAQQGMANAERQMMLISGQWQSETGQNTGQIPESGVAIGERKEQGDLSTYHFAEHMNDMDRFIGVQLLDLIPKIYDTERALQIEGDDGEKYWIQIKPNQNNIVEELEHLKDDEEAVKLAFNPTMGEYECISDPGPDTATQRQEAWSSLSMILQQNVQLASVIGDLMFKFGDFAGADQIAERLKKEIKATKPYLFDDKQDPGMTALQGQLQKMGALNGELIQKLAELKLELKDKDEKAVVDTYNAETNRIHKLSNSVSDVGIDILAPVIRQVLSEMLKYPLGPEQHTIQDAIDAKRHHAETYIEPPAEPSPAE